jgi:hypothetical protein
MHPARQGFWREAVAYKDSVTPHVLPLVLVFGLIASGICVLAWCVESYLQVRIGLEVAPHEIAGATLGLLLILRTNAGISMLVNNAGVGATAPLVDSNVDKMEDMIHLNVTALTRLAYAAVPGFVARGNGTIINISSVVAIAPERLNGVYGATKAFVLALTQTLVHELADKGVRAQAVLPGATATEFWDIAGTPVHQLPAQIVMSADDLVDAALAGLDLGETVTIPSLANKAEWDQYEAARRAMSSKLSSAIAAPRYLHQREQLRA